MFTVAIVGRPNVGKSTLFNRLAGKRSSITSKHAGTTIDWLTHNIEINEMPIRIVDSAGWHESEVSNQLDTVLKIAHLVLFVVDGAFAPQDQTFAHLLRQKIQERKLILLVNKIDNLKLNDNHYYSFGFEHFIRISAEHNLGIGDLYYELAQEAANYYEANPLSSDYENSSGTRFVKMAVVGRPNAGKSTLLNALLGEERLLTSSIPGTTRDAVYLNWSYKGRDFRVIDTAGIRKQARVEQDLEKLSVMSSKKAIELTDVAVLLLDASLGLEHQDLYIADLIISSGRGIVIALNKWDLVKNEREFLAGINSYIKTKLLCAAPVVTLSAVNKTNITTVADAVLKVAESWESRIATPRLNKWLKAAVMKFPPPMTPEKKAINLKYIAQTRNAPPQFVLAGNYSPGKQYLRYLTNSLIDNFGFIGTLPKISIKKSYNPYARNS